jgi:hypothetical protein
MIETKVEQLDHRYGPWPQPSPHHPVGESPSIINLKFHDWVDWWANIGMRYILTLLKFPFFFLASAFNHKVKEVSDREFIQVLTDGVFSKYLLPLATEIDQKTFAEFIHVGETYFIIDLSAMKTVKAFKGQYVATTKSLLKKVGSSYQILAIELQEEIFTPNEGENWNLAKYFVLQGVAICTTLVAHPVLHFPMDTINAITRTYFPINHPIAKMLKPHSRFSLSLSYAVLDFKTSVINNKWWMLYAPYPGPKAGLRELIVAGYRGIPGNDNYQAFYYPKEPTKIYSEYGDFLNDYFKVFYNYVGKVLSVVDVADPMIKNWANYIAMWIPGFPNGNDILEGDNLQRALAYFMWDVSMAHSADHYLFSLVDMQKVPIRLRHAPPNKNHMAKINLNKLTSTMDLTRYKMAMKLFFGPSAVTHLMKIDYDFNNQYLKDASKEFFAELRACEKNLKVKNYIPLDEVTASIQY